METDALEDQNENHTIKESINMNEFYFQQSYHIKY